VFALGAELAKAYLLGQRFDGDAMGCLLALGLERVEVALQRARAEPEQREAIHRIAADVFGDYWEPQP
jgi:hypothetical protein